VPGKGQSNDEAGFWLLMGRVGKVFAVLTGIFATISFFTNPNNAPAITGALVPFNAAFHWLEVTLPGIWGDIVVTAIKLGPILIGYILAGPVVIPQKIRAVEAYLAAKESEEAKQRAASNAAARKQRATSSASARKRKRRRPR
jgi:hypothetical protein